MKRLICLLSAVILLLNSISFVSAAEYEKGISATASDSYGLYKPENAVDSDINTRWALRSTTGWIALDMGEVKAVDTVEITQLSDSIISLDVLYSQDGETWNTATSYEMESIDNYTAFYNTVISFESVDARFIKIAVTDAGKSSYINICELMAYYSGKTERKAEITDFDTDYLPKDIISERRIDKIRTVIDLGIMKLGDSGDFCPDKPITRAELAYAAYVMRGSVSVKEIAVSDVSREHIYYDAIEFAVNSGIMSVDEYNRFNPDGECDTNMMARVMTSILGYDSIARKNGGYPEGYRNIAVQKGIFEGVDGAGMDRANAAVMFANTLEATVMVEKFVSGTDEMYVDGTDLLTSGMKLVKVKGQVMAAGDKSISVNIAAGENELVIDDITYICNDKRAEAYLGYAVEAYCTDEDEPQLVSIRLEKKNNVIRIFEEDMKPGNDVFSLGYRIGESETLKKIEFSRSVNAVYNGYPIVFDYNIFKEESFANGYIDAVDTNSDRKIDVVFIYQYRPYTVSAVIESAEKIYCTDDTVIELSDYEAYTIVKNGVKSSIEEISKNNVISVFEDRSREHIEIAVSEGVIKGNVSSMWEEFIAIDEAEYEIGKRLLSAFENGEIKVPDVGARVILYADVRGLIFDIESDNANLKNVYAYLVSALKPDEAELEDYGSLRLYTEKGEFEVFKLAKKVYINNIQRLPEDVFTDPRILNSSGTVAQLIKYSCNSEGKIRRIELAKRKKNLEDAFNASGLTDEENLILSNRIREEKAELDEDTFTVNAQGVKKNIRNGNMSLGSEYFFDSNTVIFKVPVNKADVKNSDYYAVWNKDIMSGKSTTECVFSTYDENDFAVAGAMVIHDGSANNEKPADDQFIMAVADVKSSYNDKESETQTVYSGLVKGSERRLTAATDVIKEAMKDVTRGDVIRFMADSNSRIYGVQKTFSYQYMKDDLRDDLKMNLSARPKPFEGFDYHIGNDTVAYEQICGTVIKVDDDRALIKTSSGGIEKERVVVYRDSTVVTACEVDGEYLTVKAASKNSIQPGCRIYARCGYGNLREAVIFYEV